MSQTIQYELTSEDIANASATIIEGGVVAPEDDVTLHLSGVALSAADYNSFNRATGLLSWGGFGMEVLELEVGQVITLEWDSPNAAAAASSGLDIAGLAAAPLRTTTDEGTIVERSVAELIAADQYTKQQTASERVPWGIRVARTRPGGTVNF